MKSVLLTLAFLAVLLIVFAVIGWTGWLLPTIRTIELPNGILLKPTPFTYDAIRIADEDGEIVVPANVGGVMWCKDFVYGWRIEKIHPGETVRHYAFLYQRGWKEARQYAFDDDDDLYRFLTENGAKPRRINDEKSHAQLLRDPRPLHGDDCIEK